jgi:RNA polymerase sigma-70 factor (ECF subfamily)
MGRRGNEIRCACVCSHVTVDRDRGASVPEVVSFDDFYATESPSLLALAVALLMSRDAAADAVQEAFLRAYRDWPRVSGMDRPGAWVRRVLINLAIDLHRRRRREAAVMLSMAGSPCFDDPEIDDFWTLVGTLPRQQRAATTLRYAEDLSVDSIAGVLGVSAGSVKRSLFSARRALAAHLNAEEGCDGND